MQENPDRNKYASIYKEINLPQKKHVIPVAESLFRTNKDAGKYVTPKIKKSRMELLESIQKELQIFEDADDYKFKFPESKFPNVPPGQRNNISYELQIKVEDEDTFKDKLSSEQVEQIREKGQFDVKSSMANVTIPYVWKINDYLLRGRVNIVNIWENGLAACYQILCHAQEGLVTAIPKSIGKLIHLPAKFFAIIFGKRSMSSIYTPDCEREVFKDFWTDIFNNELKDLKNEVGHSFLQELYLKYEPANYQVVKRLDRMPDTTYDRLYRQRQEKVNQYNQSRQEIQEYKNSLLWVEQQFDSKWAKMRRKTLAKNSNQIELAPLKDLNESEEDPLTTDKVSKRDQAIVDKLYEQKYLLYTAHLRENIPKKKFTQPVIEALIAIITIVNLIQQKIRKKNERLNDIREKIRSDIDKKHRIRSKNDKFKNDLTEKLYKPIHDQTQNQFYQNLFQTEIKNFVNQKYQNMYRKYVMLGKNFKSLVEEKKRTLKSIVIPERTFYSTYRLLPPYKIVNNRGSYTMVKQRGMQIDTSTNFWKFKLYAMRLKCWTINCAVFLIGFSWVGPTGLRCLYGINDFRYDQNCNYSTGEIYYSTRRTVIGTFLKVQQGINKSREHFESLPDRGLFGKKFSRIFNYIECYFFRLFLVGILGTLILYPIAIVVLSLLGIAMIVTVWIWVPLIMVICYLFNILVFQFETSFRDSGFVIRGVPLLSIAFIIIASVLQILFALINFLVISPVVSLFYFLFLVLQRGFRTFTDTIMIVIIAKLGRVPSRDTSIARKISGPGMSRSYFTSILQDDVYVLTQAELERIYVQKFNELTRRQIQNHMEKYRDIMNYVMDPFGYTYPSLSHDRDLINRNKDRLLQNFNTSSFYYMARYPNHPSNVRFTEQEIDQYFENSIKIVKNFVERHGIKDWIFDFKNVLYEDYDQLTRALWISIFNCGEQIFEPLEAIDSRFKMTDDVTSNTIKMRQNVGSVMKALEGEVKLSHQAADFSPAKTSLLEKDRTIDHISTICNIHDSNWETRLNLNLEDPTYLLVPPRNLEDLKKYDTYERKECLERYSNAVEQLRPY